jgi:F-type H+-transporting ATPase subunit a
MRQPTKNINVTACMAVMSAVLVFVVDCKYKGPRGWARSFYKPSPIYGMVKLMDYVVRPLSLCLRLFGNMLGGYIVIELIYGAAALVAPAVAGIYFDLFDGALQAYVFAFLTMVYLQEATEKGV